MSSDPSDTPKFIGLLTSHQAALFVFVRSFVTDITDAEDILQETNLALWEKAANYDHSLPFYPYASKIAYHKVCDFARRNRKLGGLVFNSLLLDRICSKISAEGDSGDTERKIALDSCIESLSDDDKGLLEQRYHKRRNIRDLVATSGKTETTLQYHFARIRSLLRNCIEGKTADPSTS